jgi:hypothetical protein
VLRRRTGSDRRRRRHRDRRLAGDRLRAHHRRGRRILAAPPRPLGVDVEAWPFVAVAAVASLALAAAAFARPRAVGLLALVGAAMLAFAALDVREVVHQLYEDARGLALLAGAVAALHLAAAAVAGIMRA